MIGLRPPMVGAAVLAALTGACALPQEAVRDRFHRSVAQSFPESEFVVGEGSGESREIAEERAVIDAAAAIRSELTANLRTFVLERQAGGESTTAQDVSEEIVRRVHSNAVDLIRPRREWTRRVGRSYVAVAAVRRAELGRKYLAELQPSLEELDTLWRRLSEAPSAATFHAALCRAQALERVVDAKAAEYYVATRTAILSPERQERRRAALQAIEKHRRRAVVRIVPSDTPDGAPPLAPALLAELRGLGVVARLAPDRSCDEGGLVVELFSPQECKDGPLGGIACDLQYRAVAFSCAEGWAVADEASAIGRAQHPSSATHARTAAARNLGLADFTARTARILSHALGVRCERPVHDP